MLIAYLSNSSLPSRAANSVHVMKMSAALARAGHDVVVYARSRGEDDPARIFDYYGVERSFDLQMLPTSAGRADLLFYPLRVVRDIRDRSRFDLLYGRHLHSLLAASPLGVPMVWEVHALPKRPDWRRGRHLTSAPAAQLLTRRRNLRRVVFISRALRDDFMERYGGVSTRHWDVVVAPDGADPVELGPDGRTDTHEARLDVGYVGHLYPGRGIDLILEVARRLPDMAFHVVGGTQERIDGLRATTRHLDNVVIHGHLPPAEVTEVMASFDVLVAPYQDRVAVAGGEGDTSRWMSPLKVFEYMAVGGTIVCSDLPVLREVLDDGRNAILVCPDDVRGWVSALRRLAGNPALRQRLAQQAWDDLRNRYNWSIRAKAVLDGLTSSSD